MKNIIILVLFLISYSYSQIQPVVPDFLISGTDNSPSTFVQFLPDMYFTNNENFVTAWNDYRDGKATRYAQKFDVNGNMIDKNFNASSSTSLYLNKDLYLLSLDYLYSSFFDDTNLSISAKLQDNLNQKIFESGIYSTILPWCGTGYIPGNDYVITSDKNFYFITNRGGQVSLVKIDETGLAKEINTNLNNYYYFPITQVTASVTPEGDFFFAWINGFETDSMSAGLYASFINNNDSLFIPKIKISQLVDSIGIWDYVGNFSLKSIALNDSTYKLFWLNNASSVLYSIKLNVKGEIISGIDSLLIPKSGHQYENISNVILTNKREDCFYLFISNNYYDDNSDVYTHSFVKYDFEGEQQGDIVSQQTTEFFANNLFYLGENKFFRTYSDGKDVFLDKMEYFTLLERKKINDDETGSNQTNLELTRFDINTAFSLWSDEENKYGNKLDKEGNLIGDKVILNTDRLLFFDDKESIGTWINKTNDSTLTAGYSIYDDELKEKFSKILTTAPSSYNLRLQAEIISDSVFILLLNNQNEIILFNETKSGNTLKEETIESGQISYGENIFLDELILPVESFWISWGGKFRKYSTNLEPLTQIKDLPFSINCYLGEDKFLTVQTKYDYLYVNGIAVGIIFTSEIDTIKSNIPLYYFKNGSYNLSTKRLDNKSFLAISKYSDKYFAKVFSNDGVALKDSFLINTSSSSYVTDIEFTVIEDKVFFTWSDARNTGKGYDIYGSIFDLQSITSVKEISSEVPNDFQLYQNYPNPFNPETKIRFSIPNVETRHASSLQVTLKVYDILGKEVATLLDEEKTPGLYEVSFDGKNLASGLYFYRIEAGTFNETKKMILLK